MKATTLAAQSAEDIYRIANLPPEDRDVELTDMDKPGIREVEHVLIRLLAEQDKRTRHACADAVLIIAESVGCDPIRLAQKARQACLNAKPL